MEIKIRNMAGNVTGSIDVNLEWVGHEICLGIRHGLFGSQADHTDSIKDFNDTSEALREIASAINNLADAIKNK